MKLRAEIAIEIEAADYREAALHQQALEQVLAGVRGAYSAATLVLKTRRERVAKGPRAGREGLAVIDTAPTLAGYEDG